GGDELALAAAQDRDPGGAVKVLDDLGTWDLDPRGSAEELEAAAALCHSAGWWAVPHPVAERVARPRDVDADALVVVAGGGSGDGSGDGSTGGGSVDGGATGAIAETVSRLALRWVAVD